MKEEICCITNKGKKEKLVWMNGKTMTLTFFKISTLYIKKLGRFFLYVYLLTWLNKDTPVLLKVANIWTSS